MSISVVVGTFGDDSWIKLAQVAAASVDEQTLKPASFHHVHAETLHEARNSGAEQAVGEWLCFLDADDKLDSKFIESMDSKIKEINNINALLQPSHRYNEDTPDGKANKILMHKPVSIKLGNFLIIATLVKKDTFMRVGGFRDLDLYEDWDLWIRCFHDGAKHFSVPDAIYDISVRKDSRNNPDRKTQIKISNQIRRYYGFA
jgi:glycosyltransferase involved in cell wall biosynthesis